ncbi:MAG: sulfite exporter TauE/SafE family protein [Alphaproteobacteria bacterium]|nr:sulfite exporter TauE/SafE family protein [Alphaproteobacteria bacterium]
MSIYAILVGVGLLLGIMAVLFGFGGGFVVVPLVYQLFPAYGLLSAADSHYAMQIAVATSTAVMIVSALYATLKHHHEGNVDWRAVFPMAAYIAVGGALGAFIATRIPGSLLKVLFIVYIVGVIADCLLRKGFMEDESGHKLRRLGGVAEAGIGLVIGVIASLLGVGGSVMTVPLMRRHGASMTIATALANPLSFPVAVVGTLTYVLDAMQQGVDLGPGYLGFVHVTAFVILSLASVCGVELAQRAFPKMPDKVHAYTYVGLLILVVLTMLV